jgi:DNA-binding response OmpR family regulator
MPPAILLIDGDDAFSRALAQGLGALGWPVVRAAAGDEGLALAQAERPIAIVLCAELSGTSGYAVCNRIKKDDALRDVPLVLTSAAAGADTFEQHRRLKTRAEEYLHKPFDAAALAARLEALVGPPAEADVVGIDDVEEVDSTLEALDEAARGPGSDDDADLKAFDDAFAHAAPDERPARTAADDETLAALQGAIAARDAAIAERDALLAGRDAALAERDAELARLQDRVSELLVAKGRAEDERAGLEAKLAGAAGDLEEARRRIAELEGEAEKHEHRVVKAYQRLKTDEQVREKTKKALAVALQLLDAGPGDVAPAGSKREG